MRRAARRFIFFFAFLALKELTKPEPKLNDILSSLYNGTSLHKLDRRSAVASDRLVCLCLNTLAN